MRPLAALALLAVTALAVEIPRKSPEFVILLPDGKQTLVSSYRGKVLCLAFILTTWPHCQKTTQVLSGMQRDLGPKGFSVLEGAINEDADIPRFIRQFDPPFPVGTAGRFAARDYLQMTMTTQAYVPFMVFIDRKGIIRAQFTGTDKELNDNQQDKYLRAMAEKLLAEPAVPQRKSKR